MHQTTAFRETLLSIINGKERSIFKEEIDADFARHGDRMKTVGFKFGNFHRLHCGYYGQTGCLYIRKALSGFLRQATGKTSEIKDHLLYIGTDAYAPQLRFNLDLRRYQEYITDVLVPEVALRLIARDRSASLHDARELMLKSSQYGQAMFNDEDSE